MNDDLQNDLIEVFDKIRAQKIGHKMGEYDCANDEALKWVDSIIEKISMQVSEDTAQLCAKVFAEELKKRI